MQIASLSGVGQVYIPCKTFVYWSGLIKTRVFFIRRKKLMAFKINALNSALFNYFNRIIF